MVCALVSGRSSRSSSASASDEEKADDAKWTIEDIRVRSYDLVRRLLRDGPVLAVLSGLRKGHPGDNKDFAGMDFPPSWNNTWSHSVN